MEELKKTETSQTMLKLMKKYNCKTIEEYRAIRKENKKARKKVSEPKVKAKAPVPVPASKKKKK